MLIPAFPLNKGETRPLLKWKLIIVHEKIGWQRLNIEQLWSYLCCGIFNFFCFIPNKIRFQDEWWLIKNKLEWSLLTIFIIGNGLWRRGYQYRVYEKIISSLFRHYVEQENRNALYDIVTISVNIWTNTLS